MKALRQKFMTVLTLALTMGSVFPYSIIGMATTNAQEDKVEITKATLTAGGKELTKTNSVEKGTEIEVELAWQTNENVLIEENDEVTFQLPDALTFKNVSQTQLDKNFGTYTVDGDAGILTMVLARNYRENADTGMAEKVQPYGGTIKLAATTDLEAAGTTEDVTFRPGLTKTIYYMEESSDDDDGEREEQKQQVEQPKVSQESKEEPKKEEPEKDVTPTNAEEEKAAGTNTAPASLSIEPKFSRLGGRDIVTLVDEEIDNEGNKTTTDMTNIGTAKDPVYTILDKVSFYKKVNGVWKLMTSNDKITSDDEIKLDYKWSLNEAFRSREVKAGDYFEFDLPSFFRVNNKNGLSGELADEVTGNVYGNYTVSADGKVRFVFTSNVEEFSGVNGSFWVSGKAEYVNSTDPNREKIPFVDEDSTSIPDIDLKNRTLLSKSLNNDLTTGITNDGATVTWNLIINRTAETLPGGTIVKDILPPGFTYDGVAEIVRYEVDPLTGLGNQTTKKVYQLGAADLVGVLEQDTNDKLTFKFPNDTDYYWVIRLKSKVTDLSAKLGTNKSKVFKNKVELTLPGSTEPDLKTGATWTATQGSSVIKKGEIENEANGIVKWTVDFTHKGPIIKKGTEFVDDLGNNIDLMTDKDGNALRVGSIIETTENVGLRVKSIVGKKITFETTTDITKSFKMYYYTKGTPYEPVTNKITWNGTHSDGKFDPKPTTQSGIVKRFVSDSENPEKNGYSKDTVKWSSEINADNKVAMDTWEIKDTMSTGLYMNGQDRTAGVKLVYTINKGSTWIDVDPQYYKVVWGQIDNDKNTSFTVYSENDGTGKDVYDLIDNEKAGFKIIYQTHYDQNRFNHTYTNRADLNYTRGKYSYKADNSKSFKTPADPMTHAIVMTKGGEFNAITKPGTNVKEYQILWKIGLNNKGDKLYTYREKDLLTDALPNGWKLVEHASSTANEPKYQVEIDEIDENGVRVPLTDADGNTNGFKIGLNKDGKIEISGFEKDTTKQYEIRLLTTYAPGTTNDLIPQGTITNKATYSSSDSKIADLTVSGYVTHIANNGFLKKTQARNGSQINYEVTIDPQGEELHDVVLDDKFDTTNSYLLLDKTVDVKVLSSKNPEVAYPKENYKLTTLDRGLKIEFGKFDKDGVKIPGEEVIIKDKIYVTYTGKFVIPSGVETITIRNKATITGTNIKDNTIPIEEIVRVTDSGGTAQGITGAVTLKKLDGNTGKPINNGAEFTLYYGDDDTGQGVTSKVTDSSGVLTIDGLKAGNYFLKETIPADGYYITNKDGIKFTLNVTKNGEKFVIDDFDAGTVENQQSGNLELTKVGESADEYLENAVFELYSFKDKNDQNPTKVSQNTLGQSIGRTIDGETNQFITNDSGLIQIKNLAPGLYKMKEVKAPENYMITLKNGWTDWFEVKSDNTAFAKVTAANQRIKGAISLHKTGLHGNTSTGNLKDAEFILYDVTDANDKKQVGNSEKTNVSGLVSFDKLEAGKVYQIEEKDAPVGYTGKVVIENIKVDQTGKVTYGSDDTEFKASTPIEVTNDLETTEISGKKTW